MISECFDALARLMSGAPTRVTAPYKINNDTVALEARFPRGSIKKYNPKHILLREAITKGAQLFSAPHAHKKEELRSKKEEIFGLKQLLAASLAREVMLIHRIYELETELRSEHKVKTLIPRSDRP
ncbi:hypothetical protein KJF94_00610 [Pseudomonas hormoni]|uniref:Uncharacterized protein n=1 Tax=Pseudomonas hormoni TaxID=3093767 RepID=A0ABX8EZH2_9PSED|nr:hypothetical protein [Pseudomonas hormoni]QVW24118.1 hypothetical protein KJF94_00610 [Pseudomonas hormoni]